MLSTRVQLAGRIGGIGLPVSTDGKTIAMKVGIGQKLKITTVLFIHCRGNIFFLEVNFWRPKKPKNVTFVFLQVDKIPVAFQSGILHIFMVKVK